MENLEELQPIESRSLGNLTKQERKQIEIEESLETISHYLDGLFKVPGVGWRFGLDALIGLVPNVGDITTSLLSFYILVAGVRYGVPKITLVRMAFNIGLDYLVGVIPFIGDAFRFFLEIEQTKYGFDPRTRQRAWQRHNRRLAFCDFDYSVFSRFAHRFGSA